MLGIRVTAGFIGEQTGEEEQVGQLVTHTVQIRNSHAHGSIVVDVITDLVQKDLVFIILLQLGLESVADGILSGALVVLDGDQAADVAHVIHTAVVLDQTAADNQLHAVVTVQIADGGVGCLEHLRIVGIALQVVGGQLHGQVLGELGSRDALIFRICAVDMGIGIILMCILRGALRHGHGDDQIFGEVLLQVACVQGNDGCTVDLVAVFLKVRGNRVGNGLGRIQNALIVEVNGLPQGEGVILGGVDFDLIGAVVDSNLIKAVTVEVTGSDFKQSIKALVVEHTCFVQCLQRIAQADGSDDLLGVGTIGVFIKLDDLQICSEIHTVFGGYHIELCNTVILAAGTTVFHGGFVIAIQMSVGTSDVAANHGSLTAGGTVGIAVADFQIGPVAVVILAVKLVCTIIFIAGPVMVKIEILSQHPTVVSETSIVQIKLAFFCHGGIAGTQIGFFRGVGTDGET